MKQTQQNRIQWIDTAKLIGIYLVILGHIHVTNNSITLFIYSFHMPLFFFLSGIMVKNEKVTETFTKSVKTLIVPYVCFYLINLLYFFINTYFRKPELLDVYGFQNTILGMLIGVVFDTNFSIMISHPLWFLLGLFWCRVLYSFINNIRSNYKNIIQIVSCIVFISIAYFLKTNQIFLPWSLGSAFLAYPFYLIGCNISTIIKTDKFTNKNKLFIVFAALIAFAVSYVLTFKVGEIDISRISFGRSIPLCYITASMGIIFIIMLSHLIKQMPPFLNYLAKNTIIILAFHRIITIWIIFFLRRIISFEVIDERITLPILMAVLVAGATLVVCCIPIQIINVYCSWMIGKKKKKNCFVSNN